MGQNSVEVAQYASHHALTGFPRRLRRGEFPSEQNLTNRMIGKAFLTKRRQGGLVSASPPAPANPFWPPSQFPFRNLNQRRILCNAKNRRLSLPWQSARKVFPHVGCRKN